MKKVAYYHGYLDDHFLWSNIVAEQFYALEQSNLLTNLDEIRMTIITQNDDRWKVFQELISQYKSNINIEYIENPFKSDKEMIQALSTGMDAPGQIVSEAHTFSKIRQAAWQEQALYFYFHMKNVTSLVNNLLVPGRASKFKNRYAWRQFLNKYGITEWRTAVEHMRVADVVGVDYKTEPLPHFCGSFYWMNSEYVRTLPDPQSIDWWKKLQDTCSDPWIKGATPRYRDEYWILATTLPEPKIVNLQKNEGHYNNADI